MESSGIVITRSLPVSSVTRPIPLLLMCLFTLLTWYLQATFLGL